MIKTEKTVYLRHTLRLKHWTFPVVNASMIHKTTLPSTKAGQTRYNVEALFRPTLCAKTPSKIVLISEQWLTHPFSPLASMMTVMKVVMPISYPHRSRGSSISTVDISLVQPSISLFTFSITLQYYLALRPKDHHVLDTTLHRQHARNWLDLLQLPNQQLVLGALVLVLQDPFQMRQMQQGLVRRVLRDRVLGQPVGSVYLYPRFLRGFELYVQSARIAL
ncbi:hypothetical protein QBC45DRAFT_101812 [Copromyces sp. CBS 386.78]|nr:hypothetical protein QBC45DRAFT_101812 [Copromyces sp. CBS 386.78]